MFPALDKAIEDIRAVRDCPAVQRLCLDCWGVAARSGEAEALGFAAMLLKGVAAHEVREQSIRGFVVSLPSEG